MGEKDFDYLIEGLTAALAPAKESGFTMSMMTVVTIFLALISGIATVTAFLVIGYYSNYSEIRVGKAVGDWTKASVSELQSDMKAVKTSLQNQEKMLEAIRFDQQRREKRERVI